MFCIKLAKTYEIRFVLLLRVLVFRFILLLRVGGSVWPVVASRFRYGGGYRYFVLFSVGEGGQTEWCSCCSGRFPCSRRGEMDRARGSGGSPRNAKNYHIVKKNVFL